MSSTCMSYTYTPASLAISYRLWLRLGCGESVLLAATELMSGGGQGNW